MSKKRFGSSSFLFLTAALGMASSAAVSASSNSSGEIAEKEDSLELKEKELDDEEDNSDLEEVDLADLEDNLIEAEANTEKLLKLIALGLGITAGAVTIGGATYYFKDAKNRQKFLQVISEYFGKGKPGEAEIDKTIEIAEKAEEEIKKDQVDEKNGENKATDQIVPGNADDNSNKGETHTEEEIKKDQVDEKNDESKATDQIVPGNADDNSNKGEIDTDVPENSAEKVSEGNAFSNAVHDFYALRDKVLALLPIVKKRLARSKASEETLGILDKYILFLGRDAFFGQTSFAVFKLLHLVLVFYNFIVTVYGGINEYISICFVHENFSGPNKANESPLEVASRNRIRRKKYIYNTLKIAGSLISEFLGFVAPFWSLVEVAVRPSYPHDEYYKNYKEMMK